MNAYRRMSVLLLGLLVCVSTAADNAVSREPAPDVQLEIAEGVGISDSTDQVLPAGVFQGERVGIDDVVSVIGAPVLTSTELVGVSDDVSVEVSDPTPQPSPRGG